MEYTEIRIGVFYFCNKFRPTHLKTWLGWSRLTNPDSLTVLPWLPESDCSAYCDTLLWRFYTRQPLYSVNKSSFYTDTSLVCRGGEWQLWRVFRLYLPHASLNGIVNNYTWGNLSITRTCQHLHECKDSRRLTRDLDLWLFDRKINGFPKKIKVEFFYSATYSGNAATSRAVQS